MEWEYEAIEVEPTRRDGKTLVLNEMGHYESIGELLNGWGGDGWELACTERFDNRLIIFLKRPVT